MSGNGQIQQNLPSMPTVMKSGEEPTELLLRLVWSPLETLQARGVARVFVGNGRIAVIFENTAISPEIGLVPTVEKSVGNLSDK